MRPLPMRHILFAVAAFAAVLIYLVWWVTYVGIHYQPRYSMRPPGAAAEVQATSVRLLSLVRTGQLSDAKGGEPGLPEPGAVWVVAEFEVVRHDPAKNFPCDTELVGPQQRLWTVAAFRVTRAAPFCKLDSPVGQPTRFESVFMVPARYAEQLMGVAIVDNSTAARTPVLTPPIS